MRVDNPTQNLESYFLDVVAKARAANETSGAQSGARVAEYLRGGVEAQPAADRVLEKLSLPQATPVLVAKSAEVSVVNVADDKLAPLAQVSQPMPPPASAAPAPSAAPVDLAKADEKLSSLLGKPK